MKNKNDIKDESSNSVEFKTFEIGQYDEESEIDKSSKKPLIIATILVALIAIGSILWVKGYDIVNYVYDTSMKSQDVDEEEIVETNVAVAPIDLDDIYEKIHYMSNTIIIAEDGNIWGKEDITIENIKSVLKELEGNDDYLFEELNKWVNLDFSNGVKVHNYVWDKLGGTVGKAKALNEESIEDMINRLSE